MKRGEARWIDLLLVLCIGLLVNCFYLGSGPLAGTEGHRALVGHQMAMGGDWLLPKLYDQVYLAKPPLDYWILAGLEKLTGRANELIWRLPSAIAGSVMAVFLCWIGGRWFGRMGGLASGIGCCGLVTLWGQNHTAEIDALNCLACVIASCLLIDLGFMPRPGRIVMTVMTGIAFGAALLLKGPVGLTGISAALIGPAIFNRTTRAVKQPWPWIALAIGGGIFGAYAALALHEFRVRGLPLETSGVNEIWINLWNSDRITYLIPTLLLPVILLVYSMPVSFFFPMAFYPPLWDLDGSEEKFSNDQRRLLRGAVGTLAAACAISILCGFSFPRYSYSWLPIICLVSGAVVQAWIDGIYQRKLTDWLHVMLAGAGVTYAIGIMVLVILCRRAGAGNSIALVGSFGVAAMLCALMIRWIIGNRPMRAVCALIAIIVLTGPLYGLREAADRRHRSAATFADVVRGKVSPGETVTTGHLVLDQPEIFYYSHVNVESHPLSMFIPRDFPTSRWLLLEPAEYECWLKKCPGRLTDVRLMHNALISVILARYETKTPQAASASDQ